MDEIARLLRHEGLHPRPAFLPGCGLQVGQQVALYPYRLIYRIDADKLILCGFYREPDSAPQLSSLVQLWGIFRRLIHKTPRLCGIRMLVITEVWDRRLAKQRQQLVQLLHKLGAVAVLNNGDSWLEIPAVRLLNRRKRH